MIFTPDPDLVLTLRELLAQGRYQDVLDRAPVGGDADPGVTLAVATAATRLGRLSDSQPLAESALATFRARADDDGRLKALNLLGAIMFERGLLTEAADYWGRALELSRAVGDTLFVARVSNNLASVLHMTGRVDEARSGYREALLAYQRLADRRFIAETCHNLAITCRLDGDVAGADDFSADAVRHAEVVGDPVLLALMMTGRAETLLERREFALAAESLDRAERLAREAGDELGGAEAGRVRAELALRHGAPDQAVDLALAARAVAERHGSALLGGECAAIAFRASARLGRAVDAVRFRAEAERVFNDLGATLYVDRLLGE